ncbi:MAG: HlyC/CorC family transporter [Chlorobium sp.]|nr:HlyC/CorC family transporter [Chlorobium sp.]
MDSYLLEGCILFSLIAANGFFSMAEFAIISSRASRLHELRDAGHESADIALKLLENPGKFLSAIQVGITLISTLAGAFSGMAFSAPISGLLAAVPLLAPYSTQLALAAVVVTVTFVTLVAGELAPKKIALQHPEKITLKIAASIDLLCRLSAPVVSLINGSTDMLLRMLGVKIGEKPQVSDEEVMLMIRQGAKKGVFESVEYDMVARIFRLSDKQASAMMTPRSETDWLDLDNSDEELNTVILASGRSRFPVGEKNLDNLLGIVRSVDLVSFQLTGKGGLRDAIRASMKTPLFVPESVPAFHVLELFKKNRAHLALVIDEHGSIQGTITLTDVLESIVGDVPADDSEEDKHRIVRRSQQTWLVDGLVPVDDFLGAFEHEPDDFSEEKDAPYDTMGGFMMTRLGEVPSVGDSLQWHGISFRVIKMNGQRVERILVEFNAEAADSINRKQGDI